MAKRNWKGSTVTWNSQTVGGVTDLEASFFDQIRTIFITDVEDTTKVGKVPGRITAGTLSFKFNFNPDDPGFAAMQTSYETVTSATCVLTGPSGAALETFTFTGKIMKLDGPMATDKEGIFTGAVQIALLTARASES